MPLKAWVGRFDRKELEEALKGHLEMIRRAPDLREPKPGELAAIYLEEEFEA